MNFRRNKTVGASTQDVGPSLVSGFNLDGMLPAQVGTVRVPLGTIEEVLAPCQCFFCITGKLNPRYFMPKDSLTLLIGSHPGASLSTI